MLSATPVNTSLIDLRNQIYLMTENRADTFRDSPGHREHLQSAGRGAEEVPKVGN